MKRIISLVLFLSFLLILSSCGGETAQEAAERQRREAWQAYQDANDAYERASKANDDFNNAINDYYNSRGGN